MIVGDTRVLSHILIPYHCNVERELIIIKYYYESPACLGPAYALVYRDYYKVYGMS